MLDALHIQSTSRRPLPVRLCAIALGIIWIAGVLLAPLVHAEEHLRESHALDAQLALARAAASEFAPTDEQLAAALPVDALAWEETILAESDPVAPEVDWVYGPLVAYELRTQDARAPHDDGSGHLHTHGPNGAPHSHGPAGHSHGGDESSRNPLEHGHGSLAHAALALLTAPPPAQLAAPIVETPALAARDASVRVALPAWQRTPRAQSPPPALS